MSIAYPFAAVPNKVCRGGHGAINVAVLAVMLSHGKTWASRKTLAIEVGCSRTAISKAIRYWIDNGSQYGIFVRSEPKQGETTVFEIDIPYMAEPEHIVSDPVHLTSAPRTHSVHKEEPGNKIPKEESIDGWFEQFWKSYPRRIGKTAARRHFSAAFKRNAEIVPMTFAAKLLGALTIHKQQSQWTKDGGKFIPHPSTWLNQERWNDEIDLEKEKLIEEKKKKPFIDGDQAYKKGDEWWVITHGGNHCRYIGDMSKLEWR